MGKFGKRDTNLELENTGKLHSNSKVIPSSLRGKKKANLTFQPLAPYLLCGDNNMEDVVRINKFISQAL